MSCGFVLVSHSPALAAATRDLAKAMTAGRDVPIALAAGTSDGAIGTDAMVVVEALQEVGAQRDDVLVFVDLGSAIMSTQMALEFADPDLVRRCHLSRAPFVEGAVAGAAKAAAGQGWQAVEKEARRGLAPKDALIDDDLASPASAAAPAAATAATLPPEDPFSSELPRLEYTLALNPAGYESTGNPALEFDRFEVARASAAATLERIARSHEDGSAEGAEIAEIVRTIATLVRDRRLATQARKDLARQPDAFSVVEHHLANLADKVAEAPSVILREQAIDVRVVSRLVLGALADNPLSGVANGREISTPCVLVLPELDAVSAALLRPGQVSGVEVHAYQAEGHGTRIAQLLGVPVRLVEDR